MKGVRFTRQKHKPHTKPPTVAKESGRGDAWKGVRHSEDAAEQAATSPSGCLPLRGLAEWYAADQRDWLPRGDVVLRPR